jgi:pyrimidine-nucleoside phosphorylase
MRTYELIKRKRDGSELSQDEIGHMIHGFVNGDIPDYQMAAFLMAIYFRGMSSSGFIGNKGF